MSTKSIIKSKTAWGGAAGLIVGLLSIFDIQITDAELQPIIEAIGAIISFAFVLYGRIAAKVPVKIGPVKGGSVQLLAIGFLGLCMLSALVVSGTGCARYQAWADANPRTATIVESVAQAAIISAINAKAETSENIAAHADQLKADVAAAFADGATEADVAGIIVARVFELYPKDPDARAILRAGFQEALAVPELATDGPASDADRVDCQIMAGHLRVAFAAQ